MREGSTPQPRSASTYWISSAGETSPRAGCIRGVLAKLCWKRLLGSNLHSAQTQGSRVEATLFKPNNAAAFQIMVN